MALFPLYIRSRPVYTYIDYDFRYRNGLHPTPESGFRSLAPYRPISLWHLGLSWQPASAVTLSFRIENLTDTRTYELSFVPMPGRRITAGLKWTMNP